MANCGHFGSVSRGKMDSMFEIPTQFIMSSSDNVSATCKLSKSEQLFRKVEHSLYNFLERPRGVFATAYHCSILVIIGVSLILSVLATITQFQSQTTDVLFYVEIVIVTWLAIEYTCRLISCGYRSRYQGLRGRLRFALKPFCLLDLILIIASIAVICMGTISPVFAAPTIRGLRYFQILRMVRIDRRGGSWKLLGSVVFEHRQELLTTMYLGFLGLVFSSFLIYLCEKDIGDHFNTFADALWWGVITLCTVGYGDRVPQTWQGKLIASFCALMGISFYALPAGILGSGFALKVQEQQRQKHIIKRRNPAANLIQSFWRFYRIEKQHYPRNWQKGLHVFNRQETLRKAEPDYSGGGGGLHAPHSGRSQPVPVNAEAVAVIWSFPKKTIKTVSNFVQKEKLIRQFSPQLRKARQWKDDADPQESQGAPPEDCDPLMPQDIAPAYKLVLRFIYLVKFLSARRKFKQALKPYDVKDVIEQYAAGHVEMLARIRILHQKLEIILDDVATSKSETAESQHRLHEQFARLQRQVDSLDHNLVTVAQLLTAKPIVAAAPSSSRFRKAKEVARFDPVRNSTPDWRTYKRQHALQQPTAHSPSFHPGPADVDGQLSLRISRSSSVPSLIQN